MCPQHFLMEYFPQNRPNLVKNEQKWLAKSLGRGVPRNRLEYRGYGPDNPVAPNDSPEGRALNRRVEFTILNEGETAGRGRRSR